jgi:hypothetical protein
MNMTIDLSTTGNSDNKQDKFPRIGFLAITLVLGLAIASFIYWHNHHDNARSSPSSMANAQVAAWNTTHVQKKLKPTRKEKTALKTYYDNMSAADFDKTVTVSPDKWTKTLETLHRLGMRTGFVPEYMAVERPITYTGLEAIANGLSESEVTLHYVNW